MSSVVKHLPSLDQAWDKISLPTLVQLKSLEDRGATTNPKATAGFRQIGDRAALAQSEIFTAWLSSLSAESRKPRIVKSALGPDGEENLEIFKVILFMLQTGCASFTPHPKNPDPKTPLTTPPTYICLSAHEVELGSKIKVDYNLPRVIFDRMVGQQLLTLDDRKRWRLSIKALLAIEWQMNLPDEPITKPSTSTILDVLFRVKERITRPVGNYARLCRFCPGLIPHPDYMGILAATQPQLFGQSQISAKLDAAGRIKLSEQPIGVADASATVIDAAAIFFSPARDKGQRPGGPSSAPFDV